MSNSEATERTATSPALLEALLARGVEIRAPAATVLEDLDPDRFEAGVVVHPGCTVRGARSTFGAGTHLGRAGGGWFENVCTGRGVDLYGGYFQEAVFLDGAVVRGHAEMRGGTVLEEEAETAHHVGYKMTLAFPWVIAGSLVNFCDVLLAGGTSRQDHTEIGSATALYNFTPRGDKFASRFGDVPRGVFLRSPRIFVGGQSQIVSPVRVGFGAVIAAGSGVRRDVPAGHLYASAGLREDILRPFDPHGRVLPLAEATVEYVAQLWALLAWYEHVRIPGVTGEQWADPHAERVYRAALGQVRAGIAERVKRFSKLVGRLEASRPGAPGATETNAATEAKAAAETDAAAEADAATDAGGLSLAGVRSEHEALLAAAPRIQAALRGQGDHLRAALSQASGKLRASLGRAFSEHNARQGRTDYLGFIRSLGQKAVAQGQQTLQAVVTAVEADASVDRLARDP